MLRLRGRFFSYVLGLRLPLYVPEHAHMARSVSVSGVSGPGSARQAVSPARSASASIPAPIRTSWVSRCSPRAHGCGTKRRNRPTACSAYLLSRSPAPNAP
ncbi:hypothetical protein SCYAM73S_05699 [Streptomyces cyaneofuscatus]